MKCWVVYDSYFGNTEKIAMTIAGALEEKCEVKTLSVNEATGIVNDDWDLIIVGSPTRAFKPTKAITNFTKNLPAKILQNICVAAFDTRIRITDVDSKILVFMVNLFGYAAKPIAKNLCKKGGKLVAKPEGFFVEDKEGPLFIGEIERAQKWALGLIDQRENHCDSLKD
jgi:flavodoxin